MQNRESRCWDYFQKALYVVVFMLLIASLYFLLIGPERLIPLNPRKVRGLFVILLPFCLSYLLTPVMMCLGHRFSVMDKPDPRKVHAIPTPLLGGAAVYIAFGAGAVLTLWYSLELKGVVYAATLIFMLGLLDDIKGLSSVFRLIVQVAAVFILFFHGLKIDFIPDITPFNLIERLLTIVWILGITNAVNFLDGLDGLCAGFGAIAALLFGVIAFLTRQYFLMYLGFALAGSCFGFLPWNFRRKGPALIFLGDAGSMFIGFTLASLAIMGEWAEDNTTALIVPVLILLIPIYDTTMTTFFRVKSGQVRTLRQWLDYVGKDHFHHRLTDIGMGKKKAVFGIYLISILLGISAIIVRTGHELEAFLAVLQAFVILIFITVFIVNAAKLLSSLEYCNRQLENKSGDDAGGAGNAGSM